MVVEAPGLINDDFPKAKAEVMAVMEELKLAIKDGNIDKLISFHAYGPKFTEFKMANQEMAELKMKHLNVEHLGM